jgi:hypothetical protein
LENKLSELYFIKLRDIPLVFLSADKDEKGLLSGWFFRFDKNGYFKNYNFRIDLKNYNPMDILKLIDAKRDIIKYILFSQETEYKRDLILDELLQITRVVE